MLLATFTFVVTGCKFGDGEDGLEALAQKKRLLNYHCAVAMPFLSGSEGIQGDKALFGSEGTVGEGIQGDKALYGSEGTVGDRALSNGEEVLVDMGPKGLYMGWRPFADIAVIGDEFRIQKDTLESASYLSPIKLSYIRYLSTNSEVQGDFTVLNYEFSSYAKHGNGESYATLVNFVYPFERLIMSNGDTLLCNADSIPMDFNDQDGTLSTIEERYFVALGRGRAVCSNKDVVMRDSACCQVGHDHFSYSEDRILMDAKIAILRLSLIVPAQDDFTLLEFVRSMNMSGTYLYVDKIQISNRESEASGISRAQLNLETGHMEAQPSAVSYLILNDSGNHFTQSLDIPREESQSWLYEGDYAFSWGTTVYVAVPCVEEGQLAMSPMVTVTLKNELGTAVKYYGTVSPRLLKEGGYYITTPIRLFDSIEKATSPALLYEIQPQ